MTRVPRETADGMRWMLLQAMQLSARSLVWKRGAAPAPQVLRITLPKGSPITHIAPP